MLPFKYNISDCVRMEVIEEEGKKVLELEFRFARYCLVLDSEEKMKELTELLIGKVVWPEKKQDEKPKVKLPKFYTKHGAMK